MVSSEEKAKRKQMRTVEELRREVKGIGKGSFSQYAKKEQKVQEKIAERKLPSAQNVQFSKTPLPQQETQAFKTPLPQQNAAPIKNPEPKRSFFEAMRSSGSKVYGAAATGAGKAKESADINIPSMFVYIFMILIGGLDVYLKNIVGYAPSASVFISLIIALVFAFMVWGNQFFRSLVFGAFFADLALEGILYYAPQSALSDTLIIIKVFLWLGLAITLFILGFIEHLKEREKPGIFADIVMLIIVGALIFFLFPQFLQVYELQSAEHRDYFTVVEQTGEKITVAAKEAKTSIIDYIDCIFGAGQVYTECLENKRIEKICAPYKDDEEQYAACKTTKGQNLNNVAGAADKTAESTEIKIAGPASGQIYYGEETQVLATLKTVNPHEEPVEMTASCSFQTSSSTNKQNITGKIENQEGAMPFKSGTEEKSLICAPESPLINGKYKVTFNLEMANLKTVSTLKRVFMGEKELKTEKEIKEIRSKEFPGKEYLSQAPEDFLRINFWVGSSQKEPLIFSDEQPILVAELENLGKGEIIKINNLNFNLKGITAATSKNGCFLQQSDLKVPPKAKKMDLTVCSLSLPQQLKSPEGKYAEENFEAIIEYDYKIKQEFNIEVKKVSLEQIS